MRLQIRSNHRSALLLLALLVMASLALIPMSASAQNPTNTTTIPIVGTAPTVSTGPTGTFSGDFNLQGVIAQAGRLLALGTLTGTLTNTLTGAVQQITNLPVAIPLAATGTCQILHLDLGPLNLNLLGLNVSLNEVVLDITATAAPGNLLGNLLCAVAHLLDDNASLQAVANLLNHIVSLL